MAQCWTPEQMPSMAGKTVLVTGANSGIGYTAALEFARKGAHVVLACRNAAKADAALARLQREAPGSIAEVALLDVASLSSVQQFAEAWIARGVPLDVLVNNAGVMALTKRELSPDGFERQFATNHLGHFALTGRLLPALEKASAPRVVTVASLAHRNGKMEWDNLQGERSYTGWDAYNRSKLANILFARELDRRAKAKALPLLSVAVHPGISRTSIFENGPGATGIKYQIIKLLAPIMTQDDAQGAWPTEYAAVVTDLRGGEYIGPDGMGEMRGCPKIVQPRPQALDEAAGRKLWETSEALSGVSYL